MWRAIPIVLLACAAVYSQTIPPSCESKVYCQGQLLHTVQLARKNVDSKSFVDMRMKNSEAQTLANFQRLMDQTANKPNDAQVNTFVTLNFEIGDELGNATLPDFNPNPGFVDDIRNATVKNFALELISIWKDLARFVKPEVSQNQERYSLIPVPHPFIVPGGRFKEYYYWDSFWVIDGLILSEMTVTARGMIDNFISNVERFGFVPNGGRVYYLQRSQPPLLTPMAYLYYESTKNKTWLEQNIDMLAKELNYWTKQTVTVQKGFKAYTLARYYVPSSGPRPESYKEDIHAADMYENEQDKQEIYTDMKGGAESGWDFSTRWVFDADGGNNANLSHIKTRRVAPIDLNAFLCKGFREISSMYAELGKTEESSYWNDMFLETRAAIHDLMWNETDGIWYDYDLQLGKHRTFFYPSSIAPLWAKCFDEAQGDQLGRNALNYLQRYNILDYLGGIPASEDDTGEQWDFPNAWPPLQDIVVRGLENSGLAEAREEAGVLARRWINANMIGFHEKGVMFEKYDAVVPGQYGGGGEYEVQSGFGWSNGIALRYVHDYYTTKTNPTEPSTEPSSAHLTKISGSILILTFLIDQVLS